MDYTTTSRFRWTAHKGKYSRSENNLERAGALGYIVRARCAKVAPGTQRKQEHSAGKFTRIQGFCFSMGAFISQSEPTALPGSQELIARRQQASIAARHWLEVGGFCVFRG